MKKLSVILAVLLALTMLPAAGVSATETVDDGNMLVNPDFSDTTGWAIADTATGVTIVTGDAAVGHDAPGALKITANKQEASQRVSGISKEEDYVLRLYSTKDAGVTLAGNVRIYFYDANGKITFNGSNYILIPGGSASATDTYTTNADGWTQFEYTILGTSLPDNIVELEICLRCQSGKTDGSTIENAGFYIDDVWFGKASDDAVRNLVKNPSFSDVSTGTGEAAVTWFDEWDRNSSTKATVGEDFSHGSDGASGNALLYEGGTAIDKWVQQTIEIEENKDYVFSLWQYTDAASFYGKVQFYFYNSDGDTLDYSFSNTAICTAVTSDNKTRATTGEWTEYQVRLNTNATTDTSDAEIPSGTKKVRIMLNAAQKGSEGKHLYFDDIYLGEAVSDVAYTITDADENTSAITNLTAGTVNVTYNANLASDKTTQNIVAIAALYKTDGSAKSLVSVTISDATALTAGTSTPIDLGSFTVPEVDTDKYSIRVFSLNSIGQLTPFERFAALEPAPVAES